MEFKYKKTSLVEDKEIKELGKSILPFVEKLARISKAGGYEDPASSINLPSDKDVLSEVEIIKDSFLFEKLKYILVVGIGGSNLGTQAVYEALYGFADKINKNRFPQIIFLDTNNPRFLSALESFLLTEIEDLEEIAVNIISKSGGTMETVANAEIVLNTLSKKFADIKSRVVITTDFNSKLWKIAEKEELSLLAIPEKVGGRFSVLSSVGLFPLSLAGIDVIAIREGAYEARKECLNADILKNPALVSATTLYIQSKQGRVINDNFFFNPELEYLGKWYRQLMGESIGKESDVHGNVVNEGITPTVSIGSTDLHSMGQLYLGGRRDKMTTFVYAGNPEANSSVPKKPFFGEISKDIAGKKAEDIMSAISEGVKESYKKKGLPFTEILLDDVSEKSLGWFMQFKMIEIMYLAELLEVNAFDQPSVESYKVETRKILKGS